MSGVTEVLVEDQSGPDFLQWAGTQNKNPPQIASAEGRVKALPAPPTLRYGPTGGSKFSSTFRGVFNVPFMNKNVDDDLIDVTVRARGHDMKLPGRAPQQPGPSHEGEEEPFFCIAF